MEDRDVKRMTTRLSDVVLDCVMTYIHDPKDRDAVLQVYRWWYELDSLTRKHVTIALCYTATPNRLWRRFPHLESLKKPRAAMFNLIPEDWGGFVTPWVREISQYFDCLKSLHFRRMIVRDPDLQVLACSRDHILQVLRVFCCLGIMLGFGGSSGRRWQKGEACGWDRRTLLFAKTDFGGKREKER